MPKEWGMAKLRVPRVEPRGAYSMNAMLRGHKAPQHNFVSFLVIPNGYP
jgi:hypothetical protein